MLHYYNVSINGVKELNTKTISSLNQGYHCQYQPNQQNLKSCCSRISFKAETICAPVAKPAATESAKSKMVTSPAQFKLMGICHKKAPDFSGKMAEIIKRNSPSEKGQDNKLLNSRREYAKHRWYCSGARIQFSEEKNFRNFKVLVSEHLKLTEQILNLAFSEANNYHIHLPNLRLPKLNLAHRLASFL